MEHTQAKWTLQTLKSDGSILITAGKNGFVIAEVTNANQVPAIHKGEDEANARLISAAPDLLELVHSVLRAEPHAVNETIKWALRGFLKQWNLPTESNL